MKPILIAGATLLAASGAFGFAKAVDYLARDPIEPAPVLGGTVTERRLPGATAQPRAIPQDDMIQARSLPQLATPDLDMQQTAPTAVDDQFADLGPMPEDGAPVMSLFEPSITPPNSTAPFAAVPAPVQNDETRGIRYRFENLSMIGVYR